MKTKLLLTLLTLLIAEIGFAQCTNQVENLSGTSVVNGVTVAVTSTGAVDFNTVYCNATFPYFVGYNAGTGSANGTFTFNFSPPVNAITLNFSGVSNSGENQEIVVLKINGVQYPIPSVGSANGCDPFAVLTAEGNIAGCSECPVSGWNGTTITGNISSLTVLDSAISGFGNGALFSLFICEGGTVSLSQIEPKNKYRLFPNPFSEQTTLQIEQQLKNATLTVCNALGQKVKEMNTISGHSIPIFRDNLPKGLYIFSLTEENNVIATGKLVITD